MEVVLLMLSGLLLGAFMGYVVGSILQVRKEIHVIYNDCVNSCCKGGGK